MILIKRKIIKQGHNTLTITLPKQWTAKHNICAGTELEVQERNDLLTILPDGKKIKLPTITIDVRGLNPEIIWRYVTSIYRSGYDEFKILFDNPQDERKYSAFSYNTLDILPDKNGKGIKLSPIEIIQLIINRCIGVEIIDQKENWCTVKELGETTYKEFDNALRRIFLLLLSLAEEILESLKTGGKKDIFKSIHLIDTNIDRFSDFCLRVINKKGYQNYHKTPAVHTIIYLLEMIGDELKKIALHLMESKKITPKIEELFQTRYNQLRMFYNLFYNFNKEKCLEISQLDSKWDCREIHELGKEEHHYTLELFNSLNADEKEILHHLKKIRVYLNNLTHLRIDMEY